MGGKLRRAPAISAEERFLGEYVDAYLEQAAAMTYADLTRRQAAPHANVGCGAAGIAYAFLRAFEARRGADPLEHARRWAAAAWDAHETGCGADVRTGSIMYGPAGIAFVDARVAHASGDPRRRDERIAQLLAWCASDDTDPDVLYGAAGRLAALATLRREVGEAICREPIDATGDRLAAELVRAATHPATASFAHGPAGALHAALRWTALRGAPVPPAAIDALDQLVAIPELGDAPLDRGWCRGSAGVVLTATLAFELTQRPAFLTAARRAGEHADGTDAGIHDLCCGLAGRAYALLAVDRVAPGDGWRARARARAIAAIEHATSPRPDPPRHPNGLLEGHPGLVCLALDLLTDKTAGFPVVEDRA